MGVRIIYCVMCRSRDLGAERKMGIPGLEWAPPAGNRQTGGFAPSPQDFQGMAQAFNGGERRGSSRRLEDRNNLAKHGNGRQPAFRQIIDLDHFRPATRPAGTLLASEAPLGLPQWGMRESKVFASRTQKPVQPEK